MDRHNHPKRRAMIEQSLSRIEPLESRRLLSAGGILSPALQVNPDRWGGGGWGGWGNGGYGGGGTGTGSGSTEEYYVPSAGYSPSQIEEAYGFNQVTINGSVANGAGETIAIVDAYDDPNISSDLTTFDTKFNIVAPPSLTQVSQTGAAASTESTDAGWALETSLDVEWAHAIAPGANILLVDAKNSNTNNLLTAVNYARDASGVVAVSMSWGGSEFSNQKSYDSYFTTPANHPGVTFVAAAGDNPGAEWPASSANVLSVGGTTLDATNSTGAYGAEASWSDTGGGLSQVVKEPAYQDAAQSTGSRGTPDVAYDADPNTGFQVYDSVSYEGVKGWQEIGGTSAGTPQWAALIAIADQVRASDGEASLDGATGTLPDLYGAYGAPNTTAYTAYSSVFHDITTGGGFFGGGASTGYDLATGLGTPDAPSVVSQLVTPKTIAPSLVRAVKALPPTKPHTPIGLFTTNTLLNVAPVALPAPASAAPVAPRFATNNSAPAPILNQSDNSDQLQVSALSNGPSLTLESGVVGLTSAAGNELLNLLKTESTPTIGFGSVLQNSARASISRIEADFSQLEIAAQAGAAMVSPHVMLELAQLDASTFADSLRAFVHESAKVQAGPRGAAMARPLALVAAAMLADAVLVGYWYHNRAKRRATAKVSEAPSQD